MDLTDNTMNTPIELGELERRLKGEYPYMEDEHIVRTVNRAKAIYYSVKYPCLPNVDETEKPITSFVAKEQVLMICDELIDKLGIGSAVSYRENGVSASYESAWVSDRVISLITPNIGVL